MYFRLNPECYYVKGEHKGAIYDLIEGDVHSLNPAETRLIEECETGKTIEKSDPLLNELKKRCIGNYYDKKVYIEKLRVGSPVHDSQPGQPPYLEKVFLEINNDCEQSCWYCGINGVRRNTGCIGCNTWLEEGSPLEKDKWKQVIDEISDLECNSVFFTGGDLTLEWDTVKELVDYASGKFSRIFVTINDKRFSDKIAGDLKGIATPIIQTEEIPQIRDDCRYLLIADVDAEVPEEILSSKSVTIDRVSHDFASLPNDSPLVSKKKIQKTDVFRFSHTKNKHPCLANTLAISWKGDVLPCPMLRSHSLGTVKTRHLYEIYKDSAEEREKFWNMNLEKISNCNKCEFRYACNDCRAHEEALTGDLYGKSLCSYDPKKGIWV